jgi:hypothetical protein
MNQSLSQDEWNKREKQFTKDYLKWCKSNKKSPAPIYPPELNDRNNIGDSEWEYADNEELIVDEKKRRKDEIIKKMVNAYKQRKLDKIKQGELWKGFT